MLPLLVSVLLPASLMGVNSSVPVFAPPPVSVVASSTWVVEPTPLSIPALISKESALYGVSSTTMYQVLLKESAGFKNIQSLIPHVGGPNSREDSWGICQIHLPAHPDITKKQALDPEFCITWTAKEMSRGRASQWTEFNNLPFAMRKNVILPKDSTHTTPS